MPTEELKKLKPLKERLVAIKEELIEDVIVAVTHFVEALWKVSIEEEKSTLSRDASTPFFSHFLVPHVPKIGGHLRGCFPVVPFLGIRRGHPRDGS